MLDAPSIVRDRLGRRKVETALTVLQPVVKV